MTPASAAKMTFETLVAFSGQGAKLKNWPIIEEILAKKVFSEKNYDNRKIAMMMELARRSKLRFKDLNEKFSSSQREPFIVAARTHLAAALKLLADLEKQQKSAIAGRPRKG